MEEDKGKLNLIAIKTFPASDNFVYIIDFLNKSLKEKRVMFGLTKDKEKNEMTVNIYEF
ncbi:MAG TPA: YpmA family protein [Syntrophomonadaceae bacterium]|nr:YpmA family protein [Syntrophomonadaceae bacterium]HPR93564.1 YpmA family protein [Syntrophomonadaceae bacterium]